MCKFHKCVSPDLKNSLHGRKRRVCRKTAGGRILIWPKTSQHRFITFMLLKEKGRLYIRSKIYKNVKKMAWIKCRKCEVYPFVLEHVGGRNYLIWNVGHRKEGSGCVAPTTYGTNYRTRAVASQHNIFKTFDIITSEENTLASRRSHRWEVLRSPSLCNEHY